MKCLLTRQIYSLQVFGKLVWVCIKHGCTCANFCQPLCGYTSGIFCTMSGAPTYYPPANFSGLPQASILQKPKVGLAVVCRCMPGNSNVQCLLQKRGQHSASPNKWSFPGGRLEQPGDLEDDGAVGTRRELNEECGGGSPQGLPPLIHIECCKSGKVSWEAL